LGSGFGAVFLVVFFLVVAMDSPDQQGLEAHDSTQRGLSEFLRAWLAYCSIVALIPGVLVLCVCACAGALFACVISPWHGSLYLGAYLEGMKRMIRAVFVGVCSD